jgi:glycogen debranching enzyme
MIIKPFDARENWALRIKTGDPIYEPAGTLKSGSTFGIFDKIGDILFRRQGGIYKGDTRFLSLLEVRINGEPPLLVSSKVREDNAVMTVHMTNSDIETGDRNALNRGLIHVNRLKYIWDNACYERFLVRNFDRRDRLVTFEINFEADFLDLFEVRGQKRVRRGRCWAELKSSAWVMLHYFGLDGLERKTSLKFEPEPTRLDVATALFEFLLAPRDAVQFVLRIACKDDGEDDEGNVFEVGREFYSSFRRARRAFIRSSARAASLDSSDSLFNELARRSVADLYMLLTETSFGPYPFAGIPWFSTPFGRDGILTALFTLWIDPSIAKGVLSFLAATQAKHVDPDSDAEPGKILREMREGEMARLGEVPFARYYGSIDATPLFVLLVGEYFKRTGDLDTIRQLWPNVEAALHWIDTYGDPDGDGFVEYHRKEAGSLINQGWRDSEDAIFHEGGQLAEGPIALCEVQAYVYGAKRHAAALASALDRPIAAATLSRQADVLRENFEAAFWCDDLSTYALALDGTKRPCRVICSSAGHTLLTGIASPEHARRVANTLLGTDCFSGWGVRTVARSASLYNPISYHNGSVWPHDNAIIALGLTRYDFKPAVRKLFSGLFYSAGFTDSRRLPELFCGFSDRSLNAPTAYPGACIPHSCASAALFALVQSIVGLSFEKCAKEIRFNQPTLPDFLGHLHLRGLHARNGVVDVVLRRHGSDVSVNVTRRQGRVPMVLVR